MSRAGKIAYLTGTWPHWSETFIRQELCFLHEIGVPLLPVCIFKGDDEAPEDLPEVICLNPSRYASSRPATSPTRPVLSKLINRRLALFKHRSLIRKLTDLIRAHDVCFIYSAFAGLPALLAAAASKANDVPFAVSGHANDILCCRYDDAFLYGDATEVHCCNQRVSAELVRRYPEVEPRLVYLPHGIEPADWQPSSVPWSAHLPLRFLFVGRMVAKKDPLAAIRLIHELNEAGIPAELTLAGDGVLAEKVGALGVLSPKEVHESMLSHDFLICTSQDLESGDMEGIPNVILEAMASGIPVLSTAAGSITEVLSSKNGYIIDPADPAAFIEVIRGILANVAGCRERVSEARRIVLDKFQAAQCIQRKAERLMALIDQ